MLKNQWLYLTAALLLLSLSVGSCSQEQQKEHPAEPVVEIDLYEVLG